MSLIDDCLTRMSRMAGLIFLPSFISVKCRCGFVLRPLGVFAPFWSVYLLHKIYGAQIGALVNNAVEVGEKLAELRDG